MWLTVFALGGAYGLFAVLVGRACALNDERKATAAAFAEAEVLMRGGSVLLTHSSSTSIRRLLAAAS